MSERVTVRQLLGVSELDGARLVGGAAGVDREIRRVAIVQSAGAVDQLLAGTLAVTTSRGFTGYELEVLARAAHSRGVVGLVAVGQLQVLRSTSDMCDRLGLPLIAVDDGVPVQLAAELAVLVQEPFAVAVRRIVAVTRRLPVAPTTAEQILAPVRDGLAAPVGLIGSDRTVLGGEIDIGDVELPHHPLTVDTAAGHLVIAPVFVDDPVRPEQWLAVELPPSHRMWLDAVAQLLKIAGFAVSALTARQRVVGEQDARDRSTLLTELLDGTQALGRHTVERAMRVGWRIDGWHTGIHLRLDADTPPGPAAGALIERTLRANGIAGALAERADGWVLWTTAETEPPSTSYRSTRQAVGAAIDAVRDELPLVAGVGRPYEGRGGIARTVAEAREACLFAGMAARHGRVEHIDELGARRYLARWHDSEAFSSYARTVLAPLEGQDVLLRTVQVYLDRESSASAAATFLGIHRNTVNQRVERAEQALGVDLSRPDDRLVVQLACRVLRGPG